MFDLLRRLDRSFRGYYSTPWFFTCTLVLKPKTIVCRNVFMFSLVPQRAGRIRMGAINSCAIWTPRLIRSIWLGLSSCICNGKTNILIFVYLLTLSLFFLAATNSEFDHLKNTKFKLYSYIRLKYWVTALTLIRIQKASCYKIICHKVRCSDM